MSLWAAIPYEERLAQDPRWALSEGSKFFEEKSSLQQALRKITQRLEELKIPYAVAGGMALFQHGFRRFTEDIDILVTPDGLKVIHHELEGLGYLPVFAGSKNLRDTELGVRIEFLISGQYPGDGQPKPIAFPEPERIAQDFDGIKYLNLRTLIELKLASGMTNPQRMKDLADVQELIRLLQLPADFAQQLNPYVQGEYTRLWRNTQPTRARYLRRWEHLAANVSTIDDLMTHFPDATASLAAMKADGVVVAQDRSSSDTIYLATADPEVARKYDMHEESEFFTE